MMSPDGLAANVASAAYREQLLAKYKHGPNSVPEHWRSFFARFAAGFWQGGRQIPPDCSDISANLSVFDLVHSYRELGHHGANLDPLGLVKRTPHPNLDLKNFNISESDLDRQVGTGGFHGDTDGTIRDLLAKLQKTYC